MLGMSRCLGVGLIIFLFIKLINIWYFFMNSRYFQISWNARSKEHKTNGVKYWIKILSLSFTGYSFPDLHFTSPVCSCIYFHRHFIMNSVGPITQNVNKKSLETLLRAFIFLFNPNKKQINWYSLQYLISYACKRIIGIKGIPVDSCDYPISQSREDNCSIQTWWVRKGCQHTKPLQQIAYFYCHGRGLF